MAVTPGAVLTSWAPRLEKKPFLVVGTPEVVLASWADRPVALS